ncbi:MAG TPA: hypothetical protein VGH72_24285, partial [Pseudonocardia sp.]
CGGPTRLRRRRTVGHHHAQRPDLVRWSAGDQQGRRVWVNLVRANKHRWSKYNRGLIPDDIVEFRTVDERTFTLMLDRAHNPDWFTANQLSTSRCPVPRSRCDCPSWVTGRWPWAPPAWCRPPRYPARGAVPVVWSGPGVHARWSAPGASAQ